MNRLKQFVDYANKVFGLREFATGCRDSRVNPQYPCATIIALFSPPLQLEWVVCTRSNAWERAANSTGLYIPGKSLAPIPWDAGWQSPDYKRIQIL